ncbi:FolC bifunctional protein [Meredithblackwellia eburnea MCA 4105]
MSDLSGSQMVAITSTTSGINLGLTRIHSLLAQLRHPHLTTPIVHIAGTNGKGSISAYLSSILAQSSFRVGRFNSPHLVHEHDCLQIDGKVISKLNFDKAAQLVKDVNSHNNIGATSFELLTATAFECFRQANPPLDLAVIEVGMGGATDATNVVPAEKTLLSIITSIELDHQKFLGDTIEEIAKVKTGIVKDGTDVILAKQDHPEVEQVLQRVSIDRYAKIWVAGEGELVETGAKPGAKSSSATFPLVSLPLVPIRTISRSSTSTSSSSSETSITSPPVVAPLPLPGNYQFANAAAATLAAQVLRTSPRVHSLLPTLSTLITPETIAQGIEKTRWPGRLDWIDLSLTHLISDRNLATGPPSSDLKDDGSSMRILVDGAHNPSSAIHLAEYLNSLPDDETPTTLIIGLSAPRSPASILSPLLRPTAALSSAGTPVVASRIRKIIAVPFSEPPSMPWIKPTPAREIAKVAREMGVPVVEEGTDVRDALVRILRNSSEKGEEEERVVVAGSLYLAADVYRLLE